MLIPHSQEHTKDLVQHSDSSVVSPLRQADHQLLEHYSDSRVLPSRGTPKHTMVQQNSRQLVHHSSTSVSVILVLVLLAKLETVQKQEQSDTRVLVLYSVFLQLQIPDLSIQSTRQLCSDLLVQVLNVLLPSKLVLVDSSHSSARRKSESHHQNPMDYSRFLVLLRHQEQETLLDRVLSTSTPSLQFWMSTQRQSLSVQKRRQFPFHQLREQHSPSTVLRRRIQSETTMVVVDYSDLVVEQKRLHSYRRQQSSSTLLATQQKRELHHMLVLVLYSHSTAGQNPLLSTVQQVESSSFVGSADVARSPAPHVGTGSLFAFVSKTETVTFSPPSDNLFLIRGSADVKKTNAFEGSGSVFTFVSTTSARVVPYQTQQGLFRVIGLSKESFIRTGYIGTTSIRKNGASADKYVEFEAPKPTRIYII